MLLVICIESYVYVSMVMDHGITTTIHHTIHTIHTIHTTIGHRHTITTIHYYLYINYILLIRSGVWLLIGECATYSIDIR